MRSFGMLLLSAMAAATFSLAILSVVASSIIEDLSITREQLGIVLTINVAVAAILSPRAGRVADVIGGRNGLIGIFLLSGVGFGVMGLSVAYWILIVGVVIGSVAQSAGNPATNKLIAKYLPAGRRAVVTGIKQSGVQAGAFVGGLALPIGAETIGWRPTLIIVGVLTVAVIIPVVRVIPRDEPDVSMHVETDSELPPATRWLAAYGALLGFGGAATFFVPLFAEEAVGYGPRGAGFAAAIMGLVALAGRIGWARFAERGARFIGALRTIAVLATVSGMIFLGATTSVVFLWVAVVLVGASSGSFTSVTMLAVMHTAGPRRAGRASGVVMFGYLIGLSVAPPLFGRTVDITGSYTLMWWLATAAFGAAIVVVLAWARSVARSDRADVASADHGEEAA